MTSAQGFSTDMAVDVYARSIADARLALRKVCVYGNTSSGNCACGPCRGASNRMERRND